MKSRTCRLLVQKHLLSWLTVSLPDSLASAFHAIEVQMMFCMISTWNVTCDQSVPVTVGVCISCCDVRSFAAEQVLIINWEERIYYSTCIPPLQFWYWQCFLKSFYKPDNKINIRSLKYFFMLLLPAEKTLIRIIETDPWIKRYFPMTLLEFFVKFKPLAMVLNYFSCCHFLQTYCWELINQIAEKQ